LRKVPRRTQRPGREAVLAGHAARRAGADRRHRRGTGEAIAQQGLSGNESAAPCIPIKPDPPAAIGAGVPLASILNRCSSTPPRTTLPPPITLKPLPLPTCARRVTSRCNGTRGANPL